MKRYVFPLLLAISMLGFARPEHPTSFHRYVSFKGTKQGQFKAEIDDYSFRTRGENPHEYAAKDPKMFIISRRVDQASPKLLTAHSTNELFENVTIQSLNDKNAVALTITLTNARISGIQKNGITEEVTFEYGAITQKGRE